MIRHRNPPEKPGRFRNSTTHDNRLAIELPPLSVVFSPYQMRGNRRGLVISTRRDSRLIQGTVDLVILKALTRGPQHGYAVSAWIRERTNGVLGLDDAALYQALHRLEHRRFIESEWGLSDNNRRAKFYEITRAGRRRLAQDSSAWQRYARAVFAVLDPS